MLNGDDLRLDQIKEIEKNIKKSFWLKPDIYLFGGEPTVVEEFEKILEYFLEKDYSVTLVTNGLMLERIRKVSEITSRGNLAVNVSLNYSNRNSIVEKLSVFSNLSKKKNFDVGIHCPVDFLLESKLTFVDVLKMFEGTCVSSVKFLHSKILDSSRMQYLYREYSMEANFDELIKTKIKVAYSFIPEVKPSDLEGYYLGGKKLAWECLMLPWVDMVIQPNGAVIPCEDLQMPFGNVFKERLSEIWNNGEYRNFRRSLMRDGLVYNGCNRCCHRWYADSED
jgi:radical SAM protein with 4Fe4S-binding SPASM domain